VAAKWRGEGVRPEAALSLAEDARKQSNWLESARFAGVRWTQGGVPESVEKLLREAAAHLDAAQIACLQGWFRQLPHLSLAYANLLSRGHRQDEAKAQAIATLNVQSPDDRKSAAEMLKRISSAPTERTFSDASRGGVSIGTVPLAPGATNSIFNVALLSPHSGDYEAFGKSLRCGLEIAIAQYNARAALPIRLSEYETEGEGWRAASEGKRALDEGAGILVGDILTVPTLVLAGLANQSGVSLLSPSATDPMVGATGPLVFQTGAPLEAQARALARYAVRNDKRAIIAVPANLDSAFLGAFEAEAKHLGATPARVPASTGMRDFRAVANELKRVRADAVLLPLDPEQAELWVGGLMKQGVFLPYLATDALDPQGFHAETRRVLEGMVAVSTDYALPEPTFAHVDSLARAAYGLDADRFVRRGYLTGQLITKTIAGGADSPASFATALRRRSGPLGFVRYEESEASLPILAVRRGQLVRVH